MEELKEKTAYYLFKKERIYRDKTFTSIYYKSSKDNVNKKSCPIDIDGERFKLDLETGDVRYYTKSEILNSIGCSLRRTRILMNMLLEMNDFDWFCTLTFDKEKIDRTNDEEVFEVYGKYIDNIKHKVPTFKYMCFPERHEDGCIHFHLLVGGIPTKELGLVNSGKVCCSWAYCKNKIASKEYFERTKDKHELTETDGLTVYNVTSFIYGYTTVTRIANRQRCNSYVKKYVEKALGSTEMFRKRFFYSSNLKLPTVIQQLIGADFETPKQLNKLRQIRFNPHIQNADYVNYNSEYNTLQYWEDNETKENINKGLIPLDNNELLKITGGII